MIPEAAIWAIFFLPLGSFLVIGLIIRPFFNQFSILSGLLLVASLGVALVFSVWTLRSVILGHEMDFEVFQWLQVGSATIV